jgi:hypothetical protein
VVVMFATGMKRKARSGMFMFENEILPSSNESWLTLPVAGSTCMRTFIAPEALVVPEPAAGEAETATLKRLALDELGTRVSGPATSSAAAGSTRAEQSERRRNACMDVN